MCTHMSATIIANHIQFMTCALQSLSESIWYTTWVGTLTACLVNSIESVQPNSITVLLPQGTSELGYVLGTVSSPCEKCQYLVAKTTDDNIAGKVSLTAMWASLPKYNIEEVPLYETWQRNSHDLAMWEETQDQICDRLFQVHYHSPSTACTVKWAIWARNDITVDFLPSMVNVLTEAVSHAPVVSNLRSSGESPWLLNSILLHIWLIAFNINALERNHNYEVSKIGVPNNTCSCCACGCLKMQLCCDCWLQFEF